MHHAFAVLALVPVAMLLTVSYFVLFARQKTEDASLKTFGLAVAIVLWVAAAIVLGVGIAGMCCHYGSCGKMGMMMNHEGMQGMCGMQGMRGMKDMPCTPGMKCQPGAPCPAHQMQGAEPQAAPAKEEKKK